MTFDEAVTHVGRVIDAAGVVAIAAGAVFATTGAVVRIQRKQPDVYTLFRRWLGRSILLGLELLVAADIIRTVAVQPTLSSVAVLGAIVLIRTFLSLSLELEITGHWPWQKTVGSSADHVSQVTEVPGGEVTGHGLGQSH